MFLIMFNEAWNCEGVDECVLESLLPTCSMNPKTAVIITMHLWSSRVRIPPFSIPLCFALLVASTTKMTVHKLPKKNHAGCKLTLTVLVGHLAILVM